MNFKYKILLVSLTAVLVLLLVSACGGVSISITLDANGGMFEGGSSTYILKTGLTEIKIPNNPTREGYEFEGWFWDKDIWEKPFTANSILDAPIESNMKVYAKWTELVTNTFTVTFDTKGGSAVDPIIIAQGTEITLPEDPTLTGYTFTGWYIDAEGENSATGIIPTADITLYAVWTVNQYTITFISNGGSDVSPIIQDYGSIVSVSIEPTREGYAFEGWFTDDETFIEEYIFSNMPNHNITLYADWTVNQYTITFISNGGSDVSPIIQDYGSIVSIPSEPTMEGYAFEGWFTDDDTFIEEYIFSYMPDHNITLYANWIENQYTITFISNGGSNVSPIIQDYGMAVSAPAFPTKLYFVFDGWYTDDGTFLSEYSFTIMPAEDIILYAKWIEDTTSIYIEDVNDLMNISQTGDYVLLNDIDLEGMEWTPIGISSSLAFRGTFNGNGYTISNFTITTGANYVGLFGYSAGIIENLGITDFTIEVNNTNGTYSGGLIGYNIGTISNCYTTGNVSISVSAVNISSAGGLVGYNFGGTITNCYATGDVSAMNTSFHARAGGLVGINNACGIILNSYATGNVNATSFTHGVTVGGLVGQNNNSLCLIMNCYATGEVSATIYSSDHALAGGLVGFNAGLVTNCFATGDIDSNALCASLSFAHAGGLIGTNGEMVINCFASGNVSATSITSYTYVGGLLGANNDTIINSYCLNTQNFYRMNNTTEFTTPTNSEGITASLANLQEETWLTETLGWYYDAEFWIFSTGVYPILKDNYQNIINTVIEINTVSEFMQINGSTRKYTLNSDIDLAGEEWNPLIFAGSFNGNGHSITNFTITSSLGYLGLFGLNNGIIENLGVNGYLIDVNCASFTCNVGGLVGLNCGTITNCYSTGDLSAEGLEVNAGGLVGSNLKMITNCYATGNVSASGLQFIYVGGLVGFEDQKSTIMNSFAMGDVSAVCMPNNVYCGGLVGYCLLATIINCYATGNLSAIDNSYASIGGLFGYDVSCTIVNSYYLDTQTFYRMESGIEYTTPTNTKGIITTYDNLTDDSYLTSVVGLNAYVSELDRSGNPDNVWVFIEGQNPILYYNEQ